MNNNNEQITVVHDDALVCALIEKYNFKIIGLFKDNDIGFKSSCFKTSEILLDAIEAYDAGKLELPIKSYMESYNSLNAEYNVVCNEF